MPSCIETHITKQTVYIGGRPVNLRRLSLATGKSKGYLCRILKGSQPFEEIRVGLAMDMAESMGYTLTELRRAIEQRVIAEFSV